MTLISEIFALFSETFFSQGPKKFISRRMLSLQVLGQLGGALVIALRARKQIMIIRGLNQKLSKKSGRGGGKTAILRRFLVNSPPLAGESHM